MNSSPQRRGPRARGSDSKQSVTLPFLIGAVVMSVVTCATSLLLTRRGSAPAAAVESEHATAISEHDSHPGTELKSNLTLAPSDGTAGTDDPHETPALGMTSAPDPTPHPEPGAQARELVNALVRPEMTLTREQAAEWKRNLQQLAQTGTAAVPAIAEYLSRNVDLDFGLEGGQMLGYPSARAAMFAALEQIGGPEALSVMVQTLQTTSDPREIALLAQSLEEQAPEQYRQEAINAAREALAMAAGGNADGKTDGRDVGPLFEVMQKFGGTAVVSDLEQATSRWKYYSTLALAQLPDGAGVPALIQMVREPASAGKGTLVAALEMLAQVASQYPEARAALIEQTRQNKIPPNLWPYVAASLTGDVYQYRDSVFGRPSSGGELRAIHINVGNQNLYSAVDLGSSSPERINQQLALIEELLSANNDAKAAGLLQRTRDLLLKRLPQTAAVSPVR